MNNTPPVSIRLEQLSLGYPDRILFEGVDLELHRGTLTALIGRNGTGKSTLLRTLMGLLKPLKGELWLEGVRQRELSQREIASRVSFVSTEAVRIANLSVGDVVGLGRAPYTNWIGKLSAQDRIVVEHSLHLVGMQAFFHKGINTLSDGERQRVMIARALAQDTPLILLDEPTAFLDLPNKYEIGLLLRSLAHEQGKTILFSTHDMSMALELCDLLVMISQGEFLHGSPQEMIRRGEIDRLLAGTSVAFDRERGVIGLCDKKTSSLNR